MSDVTPLPDFTITLSSDPGAPAAEPVDYRQVAAEAVAHLLDDPAYEEARSGEELIVGHLAQVLEMSDSPEAFPDRNARTEELRQQVLAHLAEIEALESDLGTRSSESGSFDTVSGVDPKLLALYAALTYDSLVFFGMLAGLALPHLDQSRTKQLVTFVDTNFKAFRKFLDAMKGIVTATTPRMIVTCFLGGCYALYKGIQFRDLLGIIFSSLSWGERLWAIATLLGQIFLLVVTAGESAILRAIEAAAQLIGVINDVLAILDAQLRETLFAAVLTPSGRVAVAAPLPS